MSLTAYLPQDRLRALANGLSLPDRANGSVLFADISGFTPLTESHQDTLGPRRGAEVVTHLIDDVYTALITEVDRFGGVVIGFAGDAVTCWFDDSPGMASPRAIAAAFAMRKAMGTFTEIPLSDGTNTGLSLKVAIATGSARRFVVGDPTLGQLDTLGGETVTRASIAEHIANPGEVLLDEATVEGFSHRLSIDEWRKDKPSGERFAVAAASALHVDEVIQKPPPDLPNEALRPWLQGPIATRLEHGEDGFLTEFRPCAEMFVRFLGIDYEADDAEENLDVFTRQLQAIVHEEEGTIIQMTIGDKGSYAHINFGAISAHEDDPRRAVKSARALLAACDTLDWLAPLQIGITHGIMLVGAYGGRTRRTYDTMGDDVNLAARLMQTAAPGEILVNGPVHKATTQDFVFEPRPPLEIKGKAEPLPVFAVTGIRQQRAIRLQEPSYALPMIGRQSELRVIEAKLDLALANQVQVIGIVAEAGIGKSRLVAEVIRSAKSKGFVGYGGSCQSDGTHTPYLAWKSVWEAFFGVDPDLPLRRQTRWLEDEIEDRAPEHLRALPLLGKLLAIPLPENEFTRNLEPKFRQTALHALLEDTLKADAEDEPLLIVIEDLHWIDTASFNLLRELAESLVHFPVCFVLAYRPAEPLRLEETLAESLPQFTKIELHELSKIEAEQAIRAKLAQLYPARKGAVPSELVEKLMTRSQGNPFYLEELLNYLRDRGLDPRNPADLQRIELPESLYTLILSRIDQLTESEQITLRVASIVGRLFRARWLTGYYPELGDMTQVRADLDNLDTLDITPLETSEPELAYLFKHIVTHEVTYESLPFDTRAKLHERLARYLELAYPNALPLEALAYHYGRSENAEKALGYYTKAGDAAFQLFALQGALTNYERAIEWADRVRPDPAEIIHLYQRKGRTLELLLRHNESLESYQELEALGDLREDDSLRLAGIVGQSIVYGYGLRNLEKARQRSEEGLAMARKVGDRRAEARSLWNLMNVLIWIDPLEAIANGESGLAVARALAGEPQATNQDREQLALNLLDFSFPLIGTGKIDLAQQRTAEARKIFEELGNLPLVATSAQRLGVAYKEEGKFEQAETVLKQSIAADQSIGNEGGWIGTSFGLLDLYPELGDFTSFFGVLDTVKPVAAREGRISVDFYELEPIQAYYHLGAIEHVRQLDGRLRRVSEIGEDIWAFPLLAVAVLAYFEADEWKAGRELLDKLDTNSGMENFLNPLTSLMPQIKAERALVNGDYVEGLAYMDEFLTRAIQYGVMRRLPAKLYLKGRLLRADGRSEEAFTVLEEARRMTSEQKARPVHWKICAHLAELEAGRGNPAAAQDLYREARTAVDFIAGHAGGEDLRASFLAIPSVQTILKNTGDLPTRL